MKRKFHLLPEVWIKAVFKDRKERVVACGAIKSGQQNDKRTEWIEHEPDEEGRFWWLEPTLIAIVYPRKIHNCDICGERIASRPSSTRSWWQRQKMKGFIEPNSVYVGLSEGCFVEPWGYDTKICLECAKKILQGVEVYECDMWNDMVGWSKEPPKINKPTFNFLQVLEKFSK